MTNVGQFFGLKWLKKKLWLPIFEIFKSQIKLYVADLVLNFETFSWKIKVLIEQKWQKIRKF